MDNRVMRAVEETIKVGYPLDAAAVLIIELDGMPEGMDKNAEKIMEVCRRNNVREVKLAKNEAERALLWAGRKGAFGSVGQVRPSYLCCDGTVPRTRLPEVLGKVIEIGKIMIYPSEMCFMRETEICIHSSCLMSGTPMKRNGF